MKKNLTLTLICLIVNILTVSGQPGTIELMDAVRRLNANVESLSHEFDLLGKKVDDILWYNKTGDVAYIDKVFITGPPLAKEKNPTGQGAGNPVKFWTYIFIPKDADPSKKYPLLVFPHGGVHANFDTY